MEKQMSDSVVMLVMFAMVKLEMVIWNENWSGGQERC